MSKIPFGRSYSEAFSARFRLKFPHLTCGSLASSAVVLAVYAYAEFDQQVKTMLIFNPLIIESSYMLAGSFSLVLSNMLSLVLIRACSFGLVLSNMLSCEKSK